MDNAREISADARTSVSDRKGTCRNRKRRSVPRRQVPVWLCQTNRFEAKGLFGRVGSIPEFSKRANDRIRQAKGVVNEVLFSELGGAPVFDNDVVINCGHQQ